MDEEAFRDMKKWYKIFGFNNGDIFGLEFQIQNHTSNLQGKCLKNVAKEYFEAKKLV